MVKAVKKLSLLPFLYASLVVLLASGIALLLKNLHHANLSLVFLLAVLVVGLRWGLAPAIYASLLAFTLYNYLFTQPYYTFMVHNQQDVDTLVFFLIAGVVTGQAAARLHDHMAWKEAAAKRLSSMYAFSEKLSASASIDEVLRNLVDSLGSILQSPVAVRVEADEGKVYSTDGARMRRGEKGWSQAGVVTAGESSSPVAAVLVANPETVHGQDELVENFCRQASIAVERIKLVDDLKNEKLTLEAEKLRSALLSSVSHDLKTPLASIIGAASSMIEYGTGIPPHDRLELQQSILAEAQRLNRYIQNLLDMTRLGGGKLQLQRDWVDIRDIIASASARLEPLLQGIVLNTEVSSEVSLLYVHGAFIEQSLVNILENACRFSAEGDEILVRVYLQEQWVRIDIIDHGPGIPQDERQQVFEMFYALRQKNAAKDQGTGTGLGLAISRGLVRAHGGEVTVVDNDRGQGTCVRVTLPSRLAEHDGHAGPAED